MEERDTKNMVTTSQREPPLKTYDEMSEEERRYWREWLFAEGLNPVAIRQEVPSTVSSYAWDPVHGVTVEYVAGRRFVVDLVAGKLSRIREIGQVGTAAKPAASSEVTESPRKRQLA